MIKKKINSLCFFSGKSIAVTAYHFHHTPMITNNSLTLNTLKCRFLSTPLTSRSIIYIIKHLVVIVLDHFL